MTQILRQGGLTAVVALAVILTGCQTNTSRSSTTSAGATHNADDLLIIDCVLPSQIRKLGQNFTYLAPRRPIKTSAVDCQIRGGEYVAYDRADYATALKIWLPLAQSGDADAQVYAGEIYEKGLGIEADYLLAAAWYRKAAAQGNTRAKINLGYLYESGLGVERDLTAAMNWYRQASGLTEGDLEFVSSVESAKRRAASQELQDLRSEAQQLRGQLEKAQANLTASRQSLATKQRAAQKLRQELASTRRVEQASQAPPETSPVTNPALQTELTLAQSERRRLLASLADNESETSKLREQLEDSQTKIEDKRTRMQQLERELEVTRQALTDARANSAPSPGTKSLQREIDESARRLERQRSEITRLTRELSKAQLNNKALTNDLQTQHTEIAAMQNRLAGDLSGKAELLRLRANLETSQQERVRLMQQLAEVQFDAAEVRQASKQTQAELALRQRQLEQSENALAQLRKGLSDATASKNASANVVAALRRAIAERETALDDTRSKIANLAEQLGRQTAAAEQAALAAQAREQGLAQEIKQRESQIENLNVQLAEALRTTADLKAKQERLAAADAERTRLAEQLSLQQITSARLQEELAIAQSSADLQKSQLANYQDALTLLQSQLAVSESALIAKTDRARELESQLAQQSKQLASQQQEVRDLEAKQLSERAQLETMLASAQEEQQSLKIAAATQQASIASLESQLLSTQKSLAASEGKAAQLKEVEEKLQKEYAKATELEQEVEKLRRRISSSGSAPKGPAIDKVVLTEESGPVIEIIEPPLAAVRGIPSALLRSPTRAVELIGRVRPEDQLLSFKINEAPGLIEDNGIFRKLIPLKRPKTPVNVVAVDKVGHRTAMDFVILPPAQRLADSGRSQVPVKAAPPDLQNDIDFGNYHALIIGNQAYSHMPNLKTPGNDARELDKILRARYGFKTQLLIDASRYQILSALNDLRSTLTPNDNLLIFYAGHGELDSVNLRGHWLPVDAEPENTANWISNVAITDVLNAMAAKHILVIADSCYSGAMTRSSLSRLGTGMSDEAKTKWYRIMAKTKARAVLTSGGLQPVLDSGGGDHSIFTAALLNVLRSNNNVLEGYKLYRKLQTTVKRQAALLNVDQDPQYSPIKFAGHETADFFFVPKRNPLAGTVSISTSNHIAGI